MNRRRLATVVRVRELQERLARAEIARSRGVLEARRRAEEQAWSLVHSGGPRQFDASMFVARRHVLAVAVSEARHEESGVRSALGDVDEAITTWRYEAQRLDGVERLAERVETEFETERLRRDIVELDDLVAGRWQITHPTEDES